MEIVNKTEGKLTKKDTKENVNKKQTKQKMKDGRRKQIKKKTNEIKKKEPVNGKTRGNKKGNIS